MKGSIRVVYLLAFLIIAGIVIGGLGQLRPFGKPAVTDMDDYFLKNAQSERAVNNIVTAVVFDYRGFDTIGEASVLFTAVCSVLVLFRGGSKE